MESDCIGFWAGLYTTAFRPRTWDVPAGSVLGIRIGGSAPDNAPDNDQIIHVPRFGGDGVVFGVDFVSSAIGNVRIVIMEESSYA